MERPLGRVGLHMLFGSSVSQINLLFSKGVTYVTLVDEVELELCFESSVSSSVPWVHGYEIGLIRVCIHTGRGGLT